MSICSGADCQHTSHNPKVTASGFGAIYPENENMNGVTPQKAVIDEGSDFRDNPQAHLFKYLNIKNLKRLMPNQATHYDKAFALISERKAKEHKYSDADKFALGITNCSPEEEFMIKVKLMFQDNSGKIHLTEQGLIMAAAIYNKFYSGKAQAEQIIVRRKIMKNRKKNKFAKKSRQKNR